MMSIWGLQVQHRRKVEYATVETSSGTSKVQIRENASTVYENEYASEPSWERVVSDVQSTHGS